MKTLALASLLSVVSVVGATGIGFLAADAKARTALEELTAVKEQAWAEAQKARLIPVSPNGMYVVSMLPPVISRADRARIDALQLSYERFIHRRAMADWFFKRGIIVAVVVAGFCWFTRKQAPAQKLEPVAGTS